MNPVHWRPASIKGVGLVLSSLFPTPSIRYLHPILHFTAMHLTTVLTSTFVFASAALALPTSLTRRQTLDCSCEIDRICNPQLTAPQAIQIYSQNQGE